ncbi:hypothetical protein GJAV_G00199010 [Gymnothorax javanicus]|nr:hypothetical protein GJAV_G00199010 [Gymnothorax javanicus]
MSSMAAAVAIMDESKREKYEAPVEEITEKMQGSFSIDEEDMETYLKYNKAAKDAVRQGNLSEGLELFKSAYKIHSSEKLNIRIQKIEETLQAMAEEADVTGQRSLPHGPQV